MNELRDLLTRREFEVDGKKTVLFETVSALAAAISEDPASPFTSGNQVSIASNLNQVIRGTRATSDKLLRAVQLEVRKKLQSLQADSSTTKQITAQIDAAFGAVQGSRDQQVEVVNSELQFSKLVEIFSAAKDKIFFIPLITAHLKSPKGHRMRSSFVSEIRSPLPSVQTPFDRSLMRFCLPSETHAELFMRSIYQEMALQISGEDGPKDAIEMTNERLRDIEERDRFRIYRIDSRQCRSSVALLDVLETQGRAFHVYYGGTGDIHVSEIPPRFVSEIWSPTYLEIERDEELLSEGRDKECSILSRRMRFSSLMSRFSKDAQTQQITRVP